MGMTVDDVSREWQHRPRATKTVPGWPKLWANFGAPVGVLSQSVLGQVAQLGQGRVVVCVASYFSSTDVSMGCAQLTIMIARCWFIGLATRANPVFDAREITRRVRANPARFSLP